MGGAGRECGSGLRRGRSGTGAPGPSECPAPVPTALPSPLLCLLRQTELNLRHSTSSTRSGPLATRGPVHTENSELLSHCPESPDSDSSVQPSEGYTPAGDSSGKLKERGSPRGRHLQKMGHRAEGACCAQGRQRLPSAVAAEGTHRLSTWPGHSRDSFGTRSALKDTSHCIWDPREEEFSQTTSLAPRQAQAGSRARAPCP